MTAATAVAAVLVGAAALLVLPPRARPDPGGGPARGSTTPTASTDPERGLLLRWRPVLTLLVGLGGWALVGGVPGIAVGAAGAAFAWRTLGRSEGPAVRRRREQLRRDLPVGVELLAACVQGGGSVEGALTTVAHALGGPVADRFLDVHRRLELGADPVQVWRSVAADAEIGPLGRVVARSHETGASVVTAVEGLAHELRERERSDAQVRANAVEVRAAAPLGLCFLPAFLLVGVVPMVAGSLPSLQVFR